MRDGRWLTGPDGGGELLEAFELARVAFEAAVFEPPAQRSRGPRYPDEVERPAAQFSGPGPPSARLVDLPRNGPLSSTGHPYSGSRVRRPSSLRHSCGLMFSSYRFPRSPSGRPFARSVAETNRP